MTSINRPRGSNLPILALSSLLDVVTYTAQCLTNSRCPLCGSGDIHFDFGARHVREISCGSCRFRAVGVRQNTTQDGEEPEQISQTMLMRLALLRMLRDCGSEPRQQILRLFELGAPTESGSLGVNVRIITKPRITDDLIARVLGREVLAELQERAPRTTIRYVHLLPGETR